MAREPIRKFATRVKEVKEKGVSLYIYGTKGSGKTGAATMVLKEARSWGFTAFCLSVTELREAVRAHTPFDGESTVVDRCRNVDFLLLDDLRAEDAAEKMFNINDIRNLIVSRYDRGLPTVITSPLTLKDWSNLALSIQDAINKCCATLKIEGEDRNKQAQEAKNAFLK